MTPETKESSPKFLSQAARDMLLAAFFFALMNVFVKQLENIPAMEIVFFRCVVSLLACWFGLRNQAVDWFGNNRLLLTLRGTFGTLALFSFFVTIQNVPLASAVTLQYLSPIFTTIIAVFVLNERIRPLHWLFYAISFAGVFFVKGFDADFPVIYLITGIASAIFSGVAYNLVRTLKGREHPLVIVLHFQLVGVAAGFLFTVFQWKTPRGVEWLYLLATGILTQLGQVHLTKALQGEQIAKISILNYTGIVYALVFGWLLFGEIYDLQTLVGIILVVAGVAASVLYSRRRTNAEELEATKS